MASRKSTCNYCGMYALRTHIEAHITTYICRLCPSFSCTARITARIHNSIRHLDSDFRNTFIVFKDWNHPRRLDRGLPLLEGWMQEQVPQPVVRVVDIVPPEPQQEEMPINIEEPDVMEVVEEELPDSPPNEPPQEAPQQPDSEPEDDWVSLDGSLDDDVFLPNLNINEEDFMPQPFAFNGPVPEGNIPITDMLDELYALIDEIQE